MSIKVETKSREDQVWVELEITCIDGTVIKHCIPDTTAFTLSKALNVAAAYAVKVNRLINDERRAAGLPPVGNFDCFT